MVSLRVICCALALAVGACAANPPDIGASCSSHGSACEEGLTCFDVYPGGYCSQTCTSPFGISSLSTTADAGSDDCPAGSVCAQLCPEENLACGKPFIDVVACLKLCKVDQDCRLDLRCLPLNGTDLKVCSYPKSVPL